MAVYTTIDDAGLYFNSVKFTGDVVDGDGTYHDQAVTGVGFQPDLLWHKGVTGARPNYLVDSVRGQGGSPTNMLHLSSTNNEAEISENTNGHIKSLDSDGWTTVSGNDSSSRANNSNLNGEEYIGWCWKESATAGFDMVGYEGTGSARTISHSLSAVPHFMIFKNRERAVAWIVYHKHNLIAAPETDFLYLDTDAATNDDAGHFNDTAPTSSVFSVATAYGTNYSGEDIIAYLWSEKQGFSKFGSYEGNGNANGTFVYTGFRPAFIMTKSVDSTSSWHMFDNKRLGYNVDNNPLTAQENTAAVTTDMIDILSNGFKLRIATDPNVAETYVYVAFAEAPFVNSNGVPCNAR